MARRKERKVDHQYFIDRPPAEVFRAISAPDQLIRWLCDTAEIDLRKGGAYRLGWNGGPQHTGTIVALTRGRTLALSWSWPGVELEGTIFRLSVTREGKGSIFHVEHTGFPADDRWVELYAGAEWGWTYFAMNLKSVLETGRDLRTPFDG